MAIKIKFRQSRKRAFKIRGSIVRGVYVHYSKEPKIFERSQGCCLYDDSGIEYVDLRCGILRLTLVRQ